MPYNPQPYTGDRYLFAGMSNAGAALGGGLHNMLARLDAQKEEDKQRARLFKSLQETADVLGIVPKEKSTVMDLETLQGVVQGHMGRQAQADQDLNRQMKVEQLRRFARDEQEDVAIGEALARFAGTPAQQPPPVSPELLERFSPGVSNPALQSALQTPGLGGRSAVNLLNVLRQMQGEEAADQPIVTQRLDGGYLGFRMPGTRQMSINPDLTLGVKEVAPNVFQDPRGGVHQFRQPEAPKLPDSFHKTMDEVTADITGAEAILADTSAKPEQRTRAQRLLNMARQRGKAVIDRYRTGGFFDDAARDAHYHELGLAGSNSTKTPPPAETPAATTGDKVTVEKEGKRYRLPKAQLEQAQREGYRLVP
jgi:hypothetical protein